MFNRRNFLKNFGIGGAVLSTPSVLANDQSTNTEFVTIKGTVSANGKGIPQVSVTDGYTVVRTDNNGKYQIKAHSQAEFVYISVPSGYEFPNEKGVARFYQKIDTSKSNVQANFTLTPLSVDDTKHQFVVWADPQIISKKDAEELQKSGWMIIFQLLEKLRFHFLVSLVTMTWIWMPELMIFLQKPLKILLVQPTIHSIVAKFTMWFWTMCFLWVLPRNTLGI